MWNENYKRTLTTQPAVKRVILHVDINSCFATIEQQANPKLRGRPVGVSGDAQSHTVIAASSKEAKKWGVKSGFTLWEAKKLCPQLIFIQGDPDKYYDFSQRFLRLLEAVSPDLEIFSIDEAWLDVTKVLDRWTGHKARGTEKIEFLLNGKKHSYPLPAIHYLLPQNIVSAINIALHIKEQIKRELGNWITCSIGISHNKFLAKSAGELMKPDGLSIITPEGIRKVLDSQHLEDLCGIGSRIKRRLSQLGIETVNKLASFPVEILQKEFGSYGIHLHNIANGIDNSPVTPYNLMPPEKSFGRSLTLPQPTADLQLVKKILFRLCEQVARRMRQKRFSGRTIHLFISFKNRTCQRSLPFLHFSQQKTFKQYFADGRAVFQAAETIFDNLLPTFLSDKQLPYPVRALGIAVTSLVKDCQTFSLLPELYKHQLVLPALDKINDKFGEFTVQRADYLYLDNYRKDFAKIARNKRLLNKTQI